MKYSKKAHCSSGKSLSWNKMGPQGAQGAQGAQGKQGTPGVIQTYYGYKSSSSATYLSGPTIVGEIIPTTAGMYQVNGVTDIYNSGTGQTTALCQLGGKSSVTPPMYTTLNSHNRQPVAGTGVLQGGPSSPLFMGCINSGSSSYATAVDLNATQVNTGTYQGLAKPAASKQYRQLAQKFNRARPKSFKH